MKGHKHGLRRDKQYELGSWVKRVDHCAYGYINVAWYWAAKYRHQRPVPRLASSSALHSEPSIWYNMEYMDNPKKATRRYSRHCLVVVAAWASYTHEPAKQQASRSITYDTWKGTRTSLKHPSKQKAVKAVESLK